MSSIGRRLQIAGGTATLVVVLTSCAASAPTAASEVFDGLDPLVVEEVMDDPVAWGKVLDEDDATRESMAQGIVRNFEQCRGAYEAYQAWVTDGPPPAVPETSAPSRPLEPAHTAIEQTQTLIEDAIAAGDPGLLRDVLVGEARCGEWIPAKAGDRDGPMIAEAVRALPLPQAGPGRAAPGAPGTVDAAGVLAEFWQAATGYQLPAGASFVAPDVPAAEPLPGGTLAPSWYEAGSGGTIAVGQSTCAWQRHWLDTRSHDTAAADAALSELTKLLDDPTFRTSYDEASQELAREQLEQARLGDPSGIADDVAVNCPA